MLDGYVTCSCGTLSVHDSGMYDDQKRGYKARRKLTASVLNTSEPCHGEKKLRGHERYVDEWSESESEETTPDNIRML